jgi:hypothetical protein
MKLIRHASLGIFLFSILLLLTIVSIGGFAFYSLQPVSPTDKTPVSFVITKGERVLGSPS